jgi:hypothetical protein
MPLFHTLRNCPPDARCATVVTHEKVLPEVQYFSRRGAAFHFCAGICRGTEARAGQEKIALIQGGSFVFAKQDVTPTAVSHDVQSLSCGNGRILYNAFQASVRRNGLCAAEITKKRHHSNTITKT